MNSKVLKPYSYQDMHLHYSLIKTAVQPHSYNIRASA